MYVPIFLLLCMFSSLYSVCCLCVNVYCTTATRCQPNCISYHISYKINMTFRRGRNSVVGVATVLRAGQSGVKSQWGQHFPHQSLPALGPTRPLIQWISCLPQGYSGRGVECWPQIPSSAEVTERVELYLYSPAVPVLPSCTRTPQLYPYSPAVPVLPSYTRTPQLYLYSPAVPVLPSCTCTPPLGLRGLL
jgi:hypothetical protein